MKVRWYFPHYQMSISRYWFLKTEPLTAQQHHSQYSSVGGSILFSHETSPKEFRVGLRLQSLSLLPFTLAGDSFLVAMGFVDVVLLFPPSFFLLEILSILKRLWASWFLEGGLLEIFGSKSMYRWGWETNTVNRISLTYYQHNKASCESVLGILHSFSFVVPQLEFTYLQQSTS